LGFAAALADDQSAKIIFVPQKRAGFLGGLSFAPNATDQRFGALAQAGLTREWYWSQNVVRVGGSYSYASANADGIQDLHSANVGITMTLDDSLMIGTAVTYNGATAAGVTASINYNTGPWTLGGFVQAARAEGDPELHGNDRLRAFEAGASYRLDTRLRIFAAVYVFDFEDEGGAGPQRQQDDAVWMVGTRVTL
jgi:predicted porin